ncbi:MAG: phosphoadenylyl-sulfate reductase [Lentisphaerae bacterium]|nr:MAG: phosphoadenylyl-sulfate reductase [Lentisphaerota bacterium]
MPAKIVDEIINETRTLDDEAFFRYLGEKWQHDTVFATSFGVEDQVITHMLRQYAPGIGVFTLDTGRLFPETYEVWEETRRRYELEITAYFPDRSQTEPLLSRVGPLSFYRSREARKQCCHIRKVLPLQRALAGKKAWITGMRREQAPSRTGLERVEWDEAHQMIKFNPLIHWTTQEVWDFVKKHDIPYNKLHDRGFVSIGCAPCTRAIEPGQSLRDGRWWWEEPEQRECGIHIVDGKLVRTRDAK